MTFDPTVNTTCKISYTRDVVRKATLEALPSFAFQLEKNAVEVKEMICSTLAEKRCIVQHM